MLPVTLDQTRSLFAERVRQYGTQAAVGEALGCTGAFVGLLMSGKGNKLPSIPMARKIEDLLGIPMRAWSLSGDAAPAKPGVEDPAA